MTSHSDLLMRDHPAREQLTPKRALSVEHLSMIRPHTDVLRDVSLALAAGEVVSLLGANGAGKSSLLSVLAGELAVDDKNGRPCSARPKNSFAKSWEQQCSATSITLNGRPLGQINAMQKARGRAVLPQKPGLAFDLDVREVIGMGAYPYPELTEADVRRLSDRAMEHADIRVLAQRRYPELSGGEQQRVHYARAILQVLCGFSISPAPRYLLLDEPTSSLDPLHQHALLKSVRNLARHHELGVLVVLHDVNLAALFSDRIALLCDGQILACDTPSKALTVDTLQKVYGVQAHVMPHPLHPGTPLIVFG